MSAPARGSSLAEWADAASLGLLLVSAGLGFWCHSNLPAIVPIHWGLDGRPNGWGPRWVNSFGFPAFTAFIFLVLVLLPRLDARKRNDPRILPVFAYYRFVVVLFMVAIHAALLAVSLGRPVDMTLLVRIAMPLLLLGIGAGFPFLPPNSFGGFRFSWTFSSEEAWTRTHRFAGKLWVAGSLIALAAAAMPLLAGAAVLVVTILVLTAVPMAYAYGVRAR